MKYRILRSTRMSIAFALLVVLGAPLPSAVRADEAPVAGEAAPAIHLPDLAGEAMAADLLANHLAVVIFGELNHAGTVAACATVLDVLDDVRFENHRVISVLIIASHEPLDELRKKALLGRYPELILHDPNRTAFGDFSVIVMPRVVIVDAKGVIVHTMPGFAPRFETMLTHSLLVACGIEEQSALDALIDPENPPSDASAVHAAQLTKMASELAKHGMAELAEAKYREALEIQQGFTPAILGLASVSTTLEDFDDAKRLYHSVLDRDPESLPAQLGLAEVSIKRGPDHFVDAHNRLENILRDSPHEPRAHFLMGVLFEEEHECEKSALHYRAAAEALLNK